MTAHDHMRPTTQKSGGGGGFMSYVAFVPGGDIGLLVAVNRADFAVFYGLTAVANELRASLAPR
jgi:serine-type D-Ala-D-Ala carboxypeptidase/endopeptidase